MFCFILPQSPLYIAAINVFYTCFWIPFLQLRHAVLSIIRLVSRPCQPMGTSHVTCLEGTCREQLEDLPVVKYRELEPMDERVQEMCLVCLGEFQTEEEVSQLLRCGHVFHLRCINSWLDRNRFTCPLCRSLLYLNFEVLHETI